MSSVEPPQAGASELASKDGRPGGLFCYSQIHSEEDRATGRRARTAESSGSWAAADWLVHTRIQPTPRRVMTSIGREMAWEAARGASRQTTLARGAFSAAGPPSAGAEPVLRFGRRAPAHPMPRMGVRVKPGGGPRDGPGEDLSASKPAADGSGRLKRDPATAVHFLHGRYWRFGKGIRGYGIVQCEETPFQMLKDPGKPAR